MTQEEKAKSYDEAIDKVAHFIKKHIGLGCIIHPNSSEAKELFNIFPELAESEDERIRKDLISFFKDGAFLYHKKTEIVVWLEKQGEKIPVVDFKAEDWYVSKVDGKIYNAKYMEQNSCKKTTRREEIEKAAFSTSGIIEQEDWFIKGAEWADEHPCCNQLEEQGQVKENQILQHDGTHEGASCKENDNSLTREPKFSIGDWIVYNRIDSSREILYVYDIRDGRYYFNDMWHFSWSVKECDEKCHLWTIEDARSGDVLASNNSIFIFNREYAAGKPEAYCGIINDEFIDNAEGCWTNEKYYPATKEQRELLFKKMIEAGYVWDENEKELKKIEQKPDDNIEPRFKVGDWITNGFDCTFQIASIENGIYYDTNNCGSDIESTDKYYRLWTLEDAKDGDVLYFSDETIVIFKDLYNATTFHSYCHIEDNVFDISKDDMPDWWEGAGFHPATKEQRNLLFSKMHEEGYEWDAEKKELKKNRPMLSDFFNAEYERGKADALKCVAWSEEDRLHFGSILNILKTEANNALVEQYKDCVYSDIKWLDTIKQRLGGGK